MWRCRITSCRELVLALSVAFAGVSAREFSFINIRSSNANQVGKRTQKLDLACSVCLACSCAKVTVPKLYFPSVYVLQIIGCTPATFSAQGSNRDLPISTASPKNGCQHNEDNRKSRTTQAGHCLIVLRGGCTFEEKVIHAQASGAAALIVVNSEHGSCPRMDIHRPVLLKGDASEVIMSIPVCMVENNWWDFLTSAGAVNLICISCCCH